MADFTKRVPGDDCEGEEGERGERGKRGRRGHRGHCGHDGRDGAAGPTGATGPTGPAAVEGPPVFPPFPATVPTVITIFVRTTGSDATGDGTSIATAFRTVQNAVRFVPHVIPPGVVYTIDATGIGVEVFPAGFQFPEIHGAAQIATFGDPSTLPFLTSASLNIRAMPQPASNVPLADTTVPAGDIVSISDDPNTGLAIVTTATPRPSWAGDSLKGKFLVDNVSGFTTCAIYGSDPNHLFLCNTSGAMTPGTALFVVETSATFQSPEVGNDLAGIQTVDITSIAFQGITFMCLDPAPDAFALLISKTVQPITELCDVEGLTLAAAPQQLLFFSSVHRNKICDVDSATFTPRRTLFLNTVGFAIAHGPIQVFRQTVFDGNQDSLSNPLFATAQGSMVNPSWEFKNVLIKNATAPDGAIYARGSGNWSLEDVEIDGSSANAIVAEGPVQVILNHVNGSGNVGVGVRVNDGAQVRVIDDGTLVTGAGGDMQVGTKAVRTWVNFRTVAPIKNELDLVSPPVGDETTGPGTGGTSLSRLYQRP